MPEAYRQKFRNSTKDDRQAYVEFAHEKERLFDKWCMSQEVESDYIRLLELLLIEEFKNCLPNEVKTYLDKNKVETLHRAATLADNYTLTHQKVFINSDLPVQSGQRPPREQLGVLTCLYQVIDTTSDVMTGGRMIQQSNAGETIVHSQLLYVITANAGAM